MSCLFTQVLKMLSTMMIHSWVFGPYANWLESSTCLWTKLPYIFPSCTATHHYHCIFVCCLLKTLCNPCNMLSHFQPFTQTAIFGVHLLYHWKFHTSAVKNNKMCLLHGCNVKENPSRFTLQYTSMLWKNNTNSCLHYSSTILLLSYL